MNILQSNLILGAGVAGISAAYYLKKQGISSTIFEKDSDWGGLCGYFTINGFRFDRFVHFSFPNNEATRNLFEKSSPTIAHPSVSYNYYHGKWLKHPAQNNLAALSTDEKVNIISDFVYKQDKAPEKIKTYDEWLKIQYGQYFAEHFPFVYTRKYWGLDPSELETKWVGIRMHSPDLKEVLKGSYEEQQENFYYTKFMHYPKKGGFRSLFDLCRKDLDIAFNEQAVHINTKSKEVSFNSGRVEKYDKLISTLPLPEIIKIIENVPRKVIDAADKLHWTSGYQVSFGFNRPDVAKHLWFYIYDEKIPAARVYSPNLKSQDNVPDNCSALQAEIFWDSKNSAPNMEKMLSATKKNLMSLCSFSEKDLVVEDIRLEPYANVSFTLDIYKNRKIILDYLGDLGIDSIGRFGKWDYLWSHQSFESGENI